MFFCNVFVYVLFRINCFFSSFQSQTFCWPVDVSIKPKRQNKQRLWRGVLLTCTCSAAGWRGARVFVIPACSQQRREFVAALPRWSIPRPERTPLQTAGDLSAQRWSAAAMERKKAIEPLLIIQFGEVRIKLKCVASKSIFPLSHRSHCRRPCRGGAGSPSPSGRGAAGGCRCGSLHRYQRWRGRSPETDICTADSWTEGATGRCIRGGVNMFRLRGECFQQDILICGSVHD